MKSPSGHPIRSVALAAVLAACASPGTTVEPPVSSTSPPLAATSPSSSPLELTGRIAFDRLDGGFGYEAPSLGTFTREVAGAAEEEVQVEFANEGLTPTWSPDGGSLLINAYAPPLIPGRPAIIGPDGSNLTVVEPEGFEAFIGCTDWSPEGTTLACSLDDDAHPETEGIYTIGVDGSDLTRVTTSPNPGVVGTAGQCGGNDFAPAFSPDGSLIAFLRAKCGSGPDPSSDQTAALLVVTVDGTSAAEVAGVGVPNSHGFSRVRWSPDGTRIVFGTEAGGLMLVNWDGTELTDIPLELDVIGDWFAYAPDWSPDGEFIVFSLWNADSTDLYVARPDGTDVTRITDAPGAEVWASWTD